VRLITTDRKQNDWTVVIHIGHVDCDARSVTSGDYVEPKHGAVGFPVQWSESGYDPGLRVDQKRQLNTRDASPVKETIIATSLTQFTASSFKQLGL